MRSAFRDEKQRVRAVSGRAQEGERDAEYGDDAEDCEECRSFGPNNARPGTQWHNAARTFPRPEPSLPKPSPFGFALCSCCGAPASRSVIELKEAPIETLQSPHGSATGAWISRTQS